MTIFTLVFSFIFCKIPSLIYKIIKLSMLVSVKTNLESNVNEIQKAKMKSLFKTVVTQEVDNTGILIKIFTNYF